MRILKSSCLIILFLFCSGCAAHNLRVSPSFSQASIRIKTVAVLPPDIKVYRLTAGGVSELMDEWNETSRSLVWRSLQKYLGQRYGYNIKFIDEKLLNDNCKDAWESTKPLYNAVASSALMHAYPGPYVFSSKVENFDYTLGPRIGEIAKACQADALFFVSGYDHEATGGRVALSYWNYIAGAITGVTTVLFNPSFMSVALVDGQTGQLLCFNASPPSAEYSFRNKGNIDSLIEWLTRDLLVKK